MRAVVARCRRADRAGQRRPSRWPAAAGRPHAAARWRPAAPKRRPAPPPVARRGPARRRRGPEVRDLRLGRPAQPAPARRTTAIVEPHRRPVRARIARESKLCLWNRYFCTVTPARVRDRLRHRAIARRHGARSAGRVGTARSRGLGARFRCVDRRAGAPLRAIAGTTARNAPPRGPDRPRARRTDLPRLRAHCRALRGVFACVEHADAAAPPHRAHRRRVSGAASAASAARRRGRRSTGPGNIHKDFHLGPGQAPSQAGFVRRSFRFRQRGWAGLNFWMRFPLSTSPVYTFHCESIAI